MPHDIAHVPFSTYFARLGLATVLAVSSSVAAMAQPRLLLEPRLKEQRLGERFTPAQLDILEKLNRTDTAMLDILEHVVIPAAWDADELEYAPLPPRYEEATSSAKYLLVDLTLQAFGAYERGRLVRWGPISSGARETPTPSGLFSLTWRSPSRVSTIDPAWILRWYFNFSNLEGLAFHVYELPGHPASHGCVRLRERDAQWVYEWGDGWLLSPSGAPVANTGTPVHVVGQYAFGAPPPWRP